MTRKIAFILLVSSLSFNLISCGSKVSEENEYGTNDSITVEIEEITETQAPPTNPQLIGKWQLIETRVGATPMSMDLGESTIEFTANNELISESDDIPAETFEFYEEDGNLHSDLWDESQKISTLSDSELILTEVVDGEQIHYVYKRI